MRCLSHNRDYTGNAGDLKFNKNSVSEFWILTEILRWVLFSLSEYLTLNMSRSFANISRCLFLFKRYKNWQIYVAKLSWDQCPWLGSSQVMTCSAEAPEIVGQSLVVEVPPVWPMGSLHHACPHSALTLSTFRHWFNPSFQSFSTPGSNFCFSVLLMPSLNQAALLCHWNAAK